jgi:hypothetical protein
LGANRGPAYGESFLLLSPEKFRDRSRLPGGFPDGQAFPGAAIEEAEKKRTIAGIGYPFFQMERAGEFFLPVLNLPMIFFFHNAYFVI